MSILEQIFTLIRQVRPITAPLSAQTNLYADLSFDSLCFVSLLTEIEEVFEIRFDITEIESCLLIERLAAKVEEKIEGISA